jgi:hypothetical protein
MPMPRRWSTPIVLGAALFLAACPQRTEEPREPVPPGVSVEPPRAAGETGSLVVPGTEPDTVLDARQPPGQTPEAQAPGTQSPAADQP